MAKANRKQRRTLRKRERRSTPGAGVAALQAVIRRNMADGLSREEIFDLIETKLAQEGGSGVPPEAVEQVRRNLRELVDREFVCNTDQNRSWIVSDPRLGARQSQKPQDLTVESYMRAMASIYNASKIELGERKRDAIILWQRFRDARVFHFDSEVYGALHHEADRYTTEDLAGLDWQMPGTRQRVPQEEGDHLRKVIYNESKRVPYPEKFPFPSVFIGYGKGIAVKPLMLSVYAPASLRDRIVEATIMGHIMTEDGYCATVFEGVAQSDEGPLVNIVWFDALRDGGWVRSEFHLEPWILPWLINIINDHRTFILETPMSSGLRRQFKQDRKSMGLPNNRRCTPPPYYTLRMKTKLIREKVRKQLGGLPSPRSYKTDRRAHERCRVARGYFPLDPELGAKLRKRGYKIFTTQIPDADTIRRLHERGMPYKRADEWLAILTTWIEQGYTSNDPNLPYIPAVRLPGKVRTRQRQPSRSWVDDPASC